MNDKDGKIAVVVVDRGDDYVAVKIGDLVIDEYGYSENCIEAANKEADVLNAALAPIIAKAREDALKEAARHYELDCIGKRPCDPGHRCLSCAVAAGIRAIAQRSPSK